jgi:hypothetical protein
LLVYWVRFFGRQIEHNQSICFEIAESSFCPIRQIHDDADFFSLTKAKVGSQSTARFIGVVAKNMTCPDYLVAIQDINFRAPLFYFVWRATNYYSNN